MVLGFCILNVDLTRVQGDDLTRYQFHEYNIHSEGNDCFPFLCILAAHESVVVPPLWHTQEQPYSEGVLIVLRVFSKRVR